MAENVGQPRSYFRDLVRGRRNTDCYITASEALHTHKLITHMGIPRMRVVVGLSYILDITGEEPMDAAVVRGGGASSAESDDSESDSDHEAAGAEKKRKHRAVE